MTDEDRYARTVGREFLPTCARVRQPEDFVESCANYIARLFAEEADIKGLVRLADAATKLRDGLFEESEPLRLLRRAAADSVAGAHFYESLLEAFEHNAGAAFALLSLALRSTESLCDLLGLHPVFKNEACRQLLNDRKSEVAARLAAIFRAKCGLDAQQQAPSTPPRDTAAWLDFPVGIE